MTEALIYINQSWKHCSESSILDHVKGENFLCQVCGHQAPVVQSNTLQCDVIYVIDSAIYLIWDCTREINFKNFYTRKK